MLYNMTSILAACSMLSCTTLVSVANPGKQSSAGNGPLSQGTGSNSAPNSDPDIGSTDHGIHGDRWQDLIPREPMWFINAGTGLRDSPVHPEDNARGLAVWWRGEHAVDALLSRIHQGYDIGARRFFINRPMGTPGNANVPGASWLTLDENKREQIPTLLAKALLDEFSEPVHIVWFVGSDMRDPREFSGWTEARESSFHAVGETNTWEQLIATRTTIGGWISTGASGLAFDESSPLRKRQHFMDLAESLNQFPFKIAVYGEAFPLVFDENDRPSRDSGGNRMLDQDAIKAMAWIGSTSYLDDRWPAGVQSDAFPLDTESTRMFVWFEKSAMRYGSEAQRIEKVNEYMDRGLIPITQDPVMFREALNRMNSSNYSRAADPGEGSGAGSGSNQSRGPVITYRRGAPSSTTTNQTSNVPDQSLPPRYQPRVSGIE